MLNLNMCVPALTLDKVTTVIRMQDLKAGDTVTLSYGRVCRVAHIQANKYSIGVTLVDDSGFFCTKSYADTGVTICGDKALNIIGHTSVYVMSQQDWYKELSCDEARQLWLTQNVEVFKLYDDDSESVICELGAFDENSTRFGVHYSDLIHCQLV